MKEVVSLLEGGGLFMNLSSMQNIQDDKDYLSLTIAYWAAPTIAQRKPSNLLSFSHNHRDLYKLWEAYKEETVAKLQLEYFEIRKCATRVLVIFFDRAALLKTLLKTNNRNFLTTMGYPGELELEEYLILLKRRFEMGCPHEVGIFLGIPLQDVVGFIENRGKGCLLNSYWKVYHNPKKAKSIFVSYDRARVDVIFSIINHGEESSYLNAHH